MQKEQAKFVNAQSHLYKGTRPNSHVKSAQTYTIKFFEFFTFYVVLNFLLTQKGQFVFGLSNQNGLTEKKEEKQRQNTKW